MNRYDRYSKSEKGKARQKRYKNKNKEKIKAQNRALFIYPGEEVCNIKGCFHRAERHHPSYQSPEVVIWLCRKHHRLMHHPPQKCLMVDNNVKCGLPSHAKRLCKKHYARMYRKNQGW